MIEQFYFKNIKNFFVLIGVLFLSACAAGGCCDADIEQVSQTPDQQALTYTVRVSTFGNCDVKGVEVDVEIPISLSSDVAPGETLKRTHDIGRIKAGKRKKRTFTIATASALVATDSLKAKVSDHDGYTACAGLGS
ncbi:MAG: hypothetical protein HQM13_20840 [SAR324 cluster bacterium]|nr:hypothetical protein [SAR324 cluster bacterium]